jgi:hypothetical protein
MTGTKRSARFTQTSFAAHCDTRGSYALHNARFTARRVIPLVMMFELRLYMRNTGPIYLDVRYNLILAAPVAWEGEYCHITNAAQHWTCTTRQDDILLSIYCLPEDARSVLTWQSVHIGRADKPRTVAQHPVSCISVR